jgi:hypothetical protein
MGVIEDQNKAKRAYRQAMEIIDREWLAAGVTEEELAQDEQLADIFDRQIASGRTVEEIRSDWETKTVAEILRESAHPAASRRSARTTSPASSG